MKSAIDQAVYRLTDYTPDPDVLRLVPEQVARECLAVPLRTEDDTLVVATARVQDKASLRRLSRASRRPIRPLATNYPDVRAALNLAYGGVPVTSQEPAAADLCLRLGYLQPDHLPLVFEKSQKTGQSFLKCCESLGLIKADDLVEAKAILSHQPYLREKSLGKMVDLSELIPWEIAQSQQIVPMCWVGGHILVGSPKPAAPGQIWEISNKIHLPIQFVILDPGTWERIYRRLYLRGSIEQNPECELAEMLVRQGRFSEETLLGALSIQKQTARPLEEVLLDLNLVDRQVWYQAKAKYYQVEYHDLQKVPPTGSAGLNEVAARIPPAVARALFTIPLLALDGHCAIGMAEPTLKRIRTITQLIGREAEIRLVDPKQLTELYDAEFAPLNIGKELYLPSPDEYAVQLGLVTSELLEGGSNRAAIRHFGKDILLEAGLIDEIDFSELQGLHCNLPFVRLEHAQFTGDQFLDLPCDLMARFGCFPLFSTAKELWLVTADPLDGAALCEVEHATGKSIWPVIAPRSIILSILERYVVPQQKTNRRAEVRIIEKLVEDGYLTQLEAAHALEDHHLQKTPLDVAIAAQSTYKPKELTAKIARILGISMTSLALQEQEITVIDPLGVEKPRKMVIDPVDMTAAHWLDFTTAKKLCALPVREENGWALIAFADPDYKPAMAELQAKVELPIAPTLTPRRELEEAIQRTLGHRNLGTDLLLGGLITRSQLNRALDLAQRTGVRLGRALLNRRYITQKQLYQFLARQSGLAFVDLAAFQIDEEVARKIPADIARQHGMLAIRQTETAVTLATTDPLDHSSLALARRYLQHPIELVVTTDEDLDTALEKIYTHEYLEESVSELIERAPDDSAYRVLSTGQIVFLILFLALSAVWLFFNHNSYFIALNAVATIFYLAFSSYKLYLIYRAMDQDLEVPVSPEEIKALKESDLPVYSVLIPVYHEAETLTELLDAIDRFDYPPTKLDIQVILEADDEETIQAFRDWNPPSHFHGVIVPPAAPKTKPKACNYGLIHARGDYIVIYDAEDLPDPDQLKKVIVAFQKVGPEVACIQSKLNYYNSDQNLLTRWFTIEYSMWFDLFLPGLNSTKSPIPLGGTSNHFRRENLLEIDAWDPFNVTEDADLGIRLYKRGYKTAIVDSTTYEEANSKLDNWIRQRSRWIKGYIQTWLVHMRHPVRLWKEIGWQAFLGFQFVVGGNFFASLINPIYWIFTTLWFLLKWHFIQQIFPPLIFYIGTLCLFIGNFAFTYINVAGAMRRDYYGMVKYALLSPIYWALASIAAWRGLIQLIYNPFYWEKTVHGLHIKTAQNGESDAKGPAQSE